MAMTISTAARTGAADTVVDLCDGGTPPAVLRIYGGTRPAGPGTTTAETVLASVTLANPAFGAASSGVATLTDPGAVTGAAAGTATWFRIVTGGTAAGGAGVIDGSVTATGGGGDLELNTTTISVGVNVDITAGGTVTMPAGTP